MSKRFGHPTLMRGYLTLCAAIIRSKKLSKKRFVKDGKTPANEVSAEIRLSLMVTRKDRSTPIVGNPKRFSVRYTSTPEMIEKFDRE